MGFIISENSCVAYGDSSFVCNKAFFDDKIFMVDVNGLFLVELDGGDQPTNIQFSNRNDLYCSWDNTGGDSQCEDFQKYFGRSVKQINFESPNEVKYARKKQSLKFEAARSVYEDLVTMDDESFGVVMQERNNKVNKNSFKFLLGLKPEMTSEDFNPPACYWHQGGLHCLMGDLMAFSVEGDCIVPMNMLAAEAVLLTKT